MADEHNADQSTNIPESDFTYIKNSKAKSEIWKDFLLIQKNGTLVQNVAVCKLCKVQVNTPEELQICTHIKK